MRKKTVTALIILAILGGCLLCSACAPAAPAPTPSPTAAPAPAPTPAPVVIGGARIDPGTRELELTGNPGTAGELLAALPALPQLARVDLTGWTLTPDEQLALRAAAREETAFVWTVDVQGVPCTSEESFLCLDGREVDVAELERVLPLLPALTQVDMCGCGVDDETMYALNQRWADVKFVWVTLLGKTPTRTDARYYRSTDKKNVHYKVYDADLDVQLKYFPELVALDIGHSGSHITRCDWVQHTPKLQILIVACAAVADISPLAQLKELSYLEIFSNWPITDVSPLAECPELRDLNMSFTGVGDITPLYACQKLRRLWLINVSGVSNAEAAEFSAQNPSCKVMKTYADSATIYGWRTDERYYWMRDMFEAEYIPENVP